MTLTQRLAKSGVQLVVENLSKFRSDMSSAAKSMDRFKSRGSLLGKVFSGVGKVLGGFLSSLRRIGEFLIAGIIFRGLETITRAIKNMIGGLLQAGAEFQQLQIRLEGIIASDLRAEDSTLSFADSMEIATGEAKELFKWITNLALQTPFDIQDVADTITLARAYGLTAERAKEVTKSVIDFSAGMGLTELQMKKIIENFGQMIQQGKITGTELRDLARGSLVPVNDILTRVAANMGDVTVKTIDNSEEIGKLDIKLKRAKDSLQVLRIRMSEYTDTTKESTKVNNKLRFDRLQREISEYESALSTLNSAQGKSIKLTELSTEEFRDMVSEGIIPVDEFMTAFTELVGERFPNAGERAGRTIKAVIGNLKDLFQGLVAFNVITPVLDVIAERMDNLIDTLTGGARGERLQELLEDIGEALVNITDIFFRARPGQVNFADVILEKLNQVRNFVVGFGHTLEDVFAGRLSVGDFVGFQTQELLRIFGFDFEFANAIGDFIADAVSGIQEKGLGGFIKEDILPGIGSFIEDLFPEDSAVRNAIEGLVETFEKLKDFWNENKDDLLKIITELLVPISAFVFDLALSGLGTVIEFLGDVADWARENPDLAERILGMVGALAALKVVLAGPVAFGFLVAIGALVDVFKKDSVIVNAVDDFLNALADGIFDFSVVFTKELEKALKVAANLGQQFIGIFVLAIVQSKAFKFFNDEIVIPLAKLMGKTVPTSDEIATRLTTNLQAVNEAGRQIGQQVSSGIEGSFDARVIPVTITQTFLDANQEFWNAGQNIGNTINEGFLSTGPLIKTTADVLGSSIGDGLVNGINASADKVNASISLMGINALFAFQASVGSQSPSKEFEKLGFTIPEGLVKGIMKGASLPVQAVEVIGASVLMAAQAPSIINNNTTQNFSMNINTSARSEPIIGNFRQLQSLAALGT